MKQTKTAVFLLLFIMWFVQTACSQSIDLQGQLSGWITAKVDDSSDPQVGLRYIPVVSLAQPIGEHTLDMELSVNAYGTGFVHALDNIETNSKYKPYRLWLRFSSPRFELRAGLQKINFGSAMLLRPLMWFDRIDPRDPLQLTDGVYGVLLRYYFLNNTNIWVWGLYGNEDLKGLEMIPTDNKKMEYGGRVQVPLFTGEIAVSYHHRYADLRKGLLGTLPLGNQSIHENRFGLDGKWDLCIGFWLEGVLIHQEIDIPQMKFQRLINLGMDYTFNLGNGLYVLQEYFVLRTSEKSFGKGEGISFSALSMNYPLGLLDMVSGMVYYDWKGHNWYRFINFQRKLDRWSFYLMGFWNPDQFQIYQNMTENNLFAGKGFQFMVVLNH